MPQAPQLPVPGTPPPQPPRTHFKKPFDPKNVFVAAAILIAGIVIAISVYILHLHDRIVNDAPNPEVTRPVTPSDHIIGDPSAPITVIEYGDIDSSYSKQFQLTMEQIMTEYLAGGKVAWVYRHFPLTTDHQYAATNALAAECAGSLGSGTIFFRFIDALETAAPNGDEFNPQNYGPVLATLGIAQDAFTTCMANGTFTQHIHDDYDNALAAGATGSPFIILLIHGQKPMPIQGAVPYTAMKKILDNAIAKLPS